MYRIAIYFTRALLIVRIRLRVFLKAKANDDTGRDCKRECKWRIFQICKTTLDMTM